MSARLLRAIRRVGQALVRYAYTRQPHGTRITPLGGGVLQRATPAGPPPWIALGLRPTRRGGAEPMWTIHGTPEQVIAFLMPPPDHQRPRKV